VSSIMVLIDQEASVRAAVDGPWGTVQVNGRTEYRICPVCQALVSAHPFSNAAELPACSTPMSVHGDNHVAVAKVLEYLAKPRMP
jgi:hypothetical protein